MLAYNDSEVPYLQHRISVGFGRLILFELNLFRVKIPLESEDLVCKSSEFKKWNLES
jgi:hypothetical protein